MMSYLASYQDLLDAVRPLLADAESVSRAHSGCRTREHAERTTDLLGDAALTVPPDWYREHPHDAYIATLASGQALTWTQCGPGEPIEIMAWTDASQGDLVWRQPLDA